MLCLLWNCGALRRPWDSGSCPPSNAEANVTCTSVLLREHGSRNLLNQSVQSDVKCLMAHIGVECDWRAPGHHGGVATQRDPPDLACANQSSLRLNRFGGASISGDFPCHFSTTRGCHAAKYINIEANACLSITVRPLFSSLGDPRDSVWWYLGNHVTDADSIVTKMSRSGRSRPQLFHGITADRRRIDAGSTSGWALPITGTHAHARTCMHTDTHTCARTHTQAHTQHNTHTHTHTRAQVQINMQTMNTRGLVMCTWNRSPTVSKNFWIAYNWPN